MNWEDIDEDDQALIEFVRRATALRQNQPLLHRASYRDRMIIRWINPSGENQTEEQWQDPGALCIGLLLDGSEIQNREFEEHERERMFLIIFNAYYDAVQFKLPDAAGGAHWRRLLDTQKGEVYTEGATHSSGEEIEVPGRSLLAFASSTGQDHEAGTIEGLNAVGTAS
jgi:isoamylase